jgi:hypothetical protein
VDCHPPLQRSLLILFRALVKAVTRLKKQQANLVAASVAQRSDKRTVRQGIKSMFLRADSEEDVDS